ncbi:MAG TPA: hypothetical protein VN626_05680 [Clostridia bacterium]|nr:hypothetical protein [Clostridia bacterium]
MGKKRSLLVDKSHMPLAVGVAFVAFTTQFGGGFASGAQIFSYFINHGVWCLFLPFFTQFLYALFFWYGMRYAYRNKLYDYRSFSDHFYGKYRVLFSNLFEITYLIMIGTASAAAFATGGSTLNMLFGLPYWLCTLIVGMFIAVIALYGTTMVRKAAATLSVLIILGLIVVLVPNIIAQWDAIGDSVSKMAGGAMSVASKESGAFGSALWIAFLYFLFQLPSVSVMYQHVEPLTSEKQVNQAAVYIFITNTVAMMLAIVGLLAVAFVPTLVGAPVPMLVLVQNGVGASLLTPIISILIILGAVSTGVNMVSGIVTRCVNAMERRISDPDKRASGHHLRNIAFSVLFTTIAFAIAQFGLMAVVKKGYAYLGYAGLISVFIPFVVRFVVDFLKKKNA